MEKKTAVEWLEEKIKANPFRIENDRLWNEAKQMEKQQVIDAFNDGYRSGHFDDGKLGSKYYQEYY